MVDMATKQIIPAVIKYTTVLAESINQVKAVGPIDVSVQMDLLKKASKLLKEVNSTMNKLGKLVDQIETHPEGRDRAVFCREKLVPAMEKLREPVDELEMLVDKDMWPMHLMEIWCLSRKVIRRTAAAVLFSIKEVK